MWVHHTVLFAHFLHFFALFIVSSYTPSVDAIVPAGSGQAPNELLNFIEKQENYIEQLESESRFCRVSFTFLFS